MSRRKQVPARRVIRAMLLFAALLWTGCSDRDSPLEPGEAPDSPRSADVLTEVVTPSGYGAATIDGTFDASEWEEAIQWDIDVKLPGGSTTPGQIFFMNDSDDAYAAFTYQRQFVGPSGTFELPTETDGFFRTFVEEADRPANPIDFWSVEAFAETGSLREFGDWFRDDIENVAAHDINDGGTEDVTTGFSRSCTVTDDGTERVWTCTYVFEASQPLNGPDPTHDIQAQPGDEITLSFVVATDDLTDGRVLTSLGPFTLFLATNPTTGTLTGTVTAAGTGVPLAGAQISIEGTSLGALTDASGNYTITNVPDGTYDVTASLIEFAPETKQATITGGQTTTLDFQLQAVFTVTVHGSVVPDIVVTLTNVNTGDFFVECTDADSEATFVVDAGEYLTHARNLDVCGTGALDDAADVTIWADPDEAKIHDTSNTENQSHVGVLYDAVNDVSFTLEPTNYKNATANPFAVGPGGESDVTLTFESPGATLQCALVDEDGNTFTMASAEHFYGVLPFGDETGLPPVPDLGLPRGIGNALATIPASGPSDDCSVSGLPAGLFVFETNLVDVNGDEKVYTEVVTVTDDDANSSATIEVTAEPNEPLSETGYLFEPLGDSESAWDLGELLTYGWGVDENGDPTDQFLVSADFLSTAPRGRAAFLLEIRDPATAETILIAEAGCSETPAGYTCITSNLSGQVSVSVTGDYDRTEANATVTWTVTLPGVSELEFRVHAIDRFRGSIIITDSAPDSGYEPAEKSDGGNSFNIMG